MNQRYDAFISAVSSEFGRARDAAAAELRKHGLRVAVQSDLRHGPAGITLLRNLHDTIRDCAEVHCLIGVRSGECPPPDTAEPFREFLPKEFAEAFYTQWEFFFARHYVPDRTWLYLATDSCQPDEPAPTGPDQPELQQRFRDHLRDRGYDHVQVATVGDVRAEILSHTVARTDAREAGAAHQRHQHHEPLHRGITANAIGSFIGGALLSLATLLLAQYGGGMQLALLLLIPALPLGGFGAIAFFVLYRRYEAILARHDADARDAYGNLRQSLAEGGFAARATPVGYAAHSMRSTASSATQARRIARCSPASSAFASDGRFGPPHCSTAAFCWRYQRIENSESC